mgnify:CR=1 FL=1
MKAGDRATIYNATLDGKILVEGEAVLVERDRQAGSNGAEQWKVRFDGESDCFTRMVHEKDVKGEYAN